MTKKSAKILSVALAISMIVSGGSSEAHAAKKVGLNKKSVTVQVGKRVTLKVKNKKKKAKVTWKSKNKKIASVSKKGKVKGLKAGSTKIICTVKQGKKKTTLNCKVTVKPQPTASMSTMTPGLLPTEIPIETAPPQRTDTPTQKPGVAVTYHPDWPSTYADDYIPLKNMSKTFRVGTAIAGSKKELAAINDPDMRGILQKHYNSTTLTNLMKPSYLLNYEKTVSSEDGMPVLDFSSCEEALQFCKDTGIQLRGHVLVWYNQTPDWFFYENYDEEKNLVDKATMQKRMESYIRQAVTYIQTNYPGVVYCWDVVNEAVGDDNTIRKDGNMWMETYAEGNADYNEYEYVKDAFTYARKYAESGVSLVYNDYNTFIPGKRKEIQNLIRYVNKDQKLIDAIGMQCPILSQWPYLKGQENVDRETDACVEYAIEDFAADNLEIMITELCVRTDGGNTQPEMENQAARYKQLYELFMKMDKDNGGVADITSVTTFGISDSYRLYPESSWRPGDQSRYAWFFDKNCKAKLSFKCVYNVFAKAAGEETVPETYENPEGEKSAVTHVVSGVLQSKNGKRLSEKRISFEGNSFYNFYSVVTDENGFYSVELPDDFYQLYCEGETIECSLSAEDPVAVEKNITLEHNYYDISGKITSANGNAIGEKYLTLKLQILGEKYVKYEFLHLDSEGTFQGCFPEGTGIIYPEEEEETEESEICRFEINQDVDVTKPLEFVTSYNTYQIKVELDAEMQKFAGVETGNIAWVSLRDDDYNGASMYLENGICETSLKEGTYALILNFWVDDEVDGTTVYYADIDLGKDTTVMVEKRHVHEVSLVSEQNIQKSVNIDINGKYFGNKTVYLGNISGTIAGKGYGLDEEGVVTGFYRIHVPFALTDEDGEKIEIELKPTEYAVPEIKYGEMTATTIADFEKEDNFYNGYLLYQFTPEESGAYTFFSESGLNVSEEHYNESWCYVWDSQLNYIIETSSENQSIDFSGTAELEAGKTYYIRVGFFSDEDLSEAAFPIGVKKAEAIDKME